MLVVEETGVFEEPEGSGKAAVDALKHAVSLPREGAVPLRVTLAGKTFEIHNSFVHDGATVLTGREPVDPKDPGVPCPDGWCCVSKDTRLVAVTYPISITSTRSTRLILAEFK